MSLFDDIDETDDIFSSPSRTKKKPNKPSFEQLLDDDSELFIEQSPAMSKRQVEDDQPEENGDGTNSTEEASTSAEKTAQELEDEELFSGGASNGQSKRKERSSLFDDDEDEEDEAEDKNSGDEKFSYTWSPGADTSAVDEGEVAGGEQDGEGEGSGRELEVSDGEEMVDGEDSTDGNIDMVYDKDLTYEERRQLRKEKREMNGAVPDSNKGGKSAQDGVAAELSNQVSVLTKNLQSQQSENSSLKRENEQLRQELSDLTDRVAGLEKEAKQSERKLKEREEEIKQKDAEIAELKSKQPSLEKKQHPLPIKKAVELKPTSRPSSAEGASGKTKLRSGVDKGRTVTSVADSVKKFGGAGAASPEPTRVTKPKPAPKKPEIKTSASPALESKATPAKATADIPKSPAVGKKPVPSTKPRPTPVTTTTTTTKKMDKEPEKEVPKPTDEVVTTQDSDLVDSTDTHTTHDVINIFEQRTSLPQVDTPPWKRQLRNREKESPPPADSKAPSSHSFSSRAPPSTTTPTSTAGTASTQEEQPTKEPERIEAKPATVNGVQDTPELEDSLGDPVVIPSQKRALSPSKSTSSVPAAAASPNVKLREKNLTKTTSGSGISSEDMDGKRASWLPKRIECAVCNRVVYAMEKLEADNVTYHKTCFKCSVCNKTLSTGTYAALQGKIYCKVHFKQLFKMKGNYDEGFGREQHKTKWSKKGEDGEAVEA